MQDITNCGRLASLGATRGRHGNLQILSDCFDARPNQGMLYAAMKGNPMIDDHLTDAERRDLEKARLNDSQVHESEYRARAMKPGGWPIKIKSDDQSAILENCVFSEPIHVIQETIMEAIRNCDSADACAAILGAVHGSTVFGPRDLDDLGNRISRFAWSQLDPKEAG